VAGKISSFETSDDLIGNQTCNLQLAAKFLNQLHYHVPLKILPETEEIVKVARVEIYAFMASRWFKVRGSTNNAKLYKQEDRLCGPWSGDPGSIPGTTRKKKVVGMERGPLSLVSTTEERLDRKVAAPV
jgi:hypothetical protein